MSNRTIPRQLKLNPDKDKFLDDLAIKEALETEHLEANTECLWHQMAYDTASTTFQDVTKGHPLYPCIDCNGYGHPYDSDKPCKDYRPLYELQ